MFRDEAQRQAAVRALASCLQRVSSLMSREEIAPAPIEVNALSSGEFILWRLCIWALDTANGSPEVGQLFRLDPEIREHALNFLVAIHGGQENIDGWLATFRRAGNRKGAT